MVEPACVLYVPAKQASQPEIKTVPRPVSYVPAGQELHAVAPVPVPYFPAPHKEQVLDELPPVLVEYVPAAQAVHDTLRIPPVPVANVPTGHGSQPDVFAKEPAAQLIGTMMPGVNESPLKL